MLTSSRRKLVAVICAMFSLSGNVFDDYELPTLKTKFVRCSVRTCIRHVEQLLRLKLGVPGHLTVQVICGDRILEEWITLKQVWLSCWFTKVTSVLCLILRKLLAVQLLQECRKQL